MKNLILFIVFIILSITKTIAQKPNYNVVFLEEYYNEYISLSSQTEQDLKTLYLDKVRTPIFQKFFMQSEYASFIYEDLARPSLNIEHLSNTIEGITTNRKEIEKQILTALKNCNTLLQIDELTIYVQPVSSELKMMAETMGGVFGFTAGSKQVLISLDTSVNGWQEMLSYAIAHEYNHAYWTQENFAKLKQWTLLDYLVFEGRGDYFAKLLYPKIKTPWTMALSDQNKNDLWTMLSSQLQNQDFSFHAEVMFGSQKFPAWGGYSLGYEIVQSSLSKDKSIDPKVWANFSSQKILSGSKYQL